MPRKDLPPNLDNLFSELASENDRAVILVGGGLVEFALERAIAARLREPDTETEASKLFNDREGILGTFSEKIWAAYYLKVIGPETRQNIDLLRRIRNEAAHNLNPISFENVPEIAARCRELKMAKDTTPDRSEPQGLRDRFLSIVRFFAGNLLLRSWDETAEIADAGTTLAPTLNR